MVKLYLVLFCKGVGGWFIVIGCFLVLFEIGLFVFDLVCLGFCVGCL